MKYKSKIEGNESVTLTFKDKTAIEINSCIFIVLGGLTWISGLVL